MISGRVVLYSSQVTGINEKLRILFMGGVRWLHISILLVRVSGETCGNFYDRSERLELVDIPPRHT